MDMQTMAERRPCRSSFYLDADLL